jgi:hypothetical protein
MRASIDTCVYPDEAIDCHGIRRTKRAGARGECVVTDWGG